MGRFSKAEAEARGWIIVHQREAREVSTAAGETRKQPGSYRAEKYVNDVLINEEGETQGLLLERIALKEAQLEAANVPQTPAVIPEDIPRDEAGIEQRTVIVSAEPGDLSPDKKVTKISDAELTSLARTDSVLVHDEDGEPVMRHFRPTDAAIAADEATDAQSAAIENRRTAEPEVEDAVQVFTDNSDAVDSPGQSGPSQVIVRGDEAKDGVLDTVTFNERRADESTDAESERVRRQTEIGFHPAPEGEEDLAGVGVSIRDRAALGSEVPKQGETAAAAEAILNPPEPEPEPDVSPTEAPVEARQEAQEAKAQELAQIPEGDKPEKVKEVLAAGTEAEQEVTDEQAQEAEDGEEPEAS